MKNISLFPLKMCLILVIVLMISALAMADKEAEQHFEKANELLKSMDYQGAIAEYSKVINLSSGSKVAQDAHYWIGQSHFKAGQFDAAQATFAKLIEQYPASAIIPVTKLMVERVEQAKKNDEKSRAMSDAADKGFVIDQDTGVKFIKTRSLIGKKDVIGYTVGLNLSPNSKFLLHGGLVIPLDSGEPFKLVDMPALRGTWSPDGTKAAFFSKDAIWIVPVSPETGQSTGPPKKLLDGRFRFQHPVSWSPDSQKLVFARFVEASNWDVWTISVTDGSLAQITSDPDAAEGAPAWSPDGKTIAHGMLKDRYSLCLTSAEGGAPRKIFEPGRKCVPIWSPDGKWIILEPGRNKILRFIRLSDNKEYALTIPGPVGNFFSWSSDGKKMLFYNPPYAQRSVLKIVSASGGPSVELGRHTLLWPYGQWWYSDSRTIIVEGQNQRGDPALWVVPLSGREPIQLTIDFHVDTKPVPYSLSHQWDKVVFGIMNSEGTEDYWVAPVSLQEARTTGPAVMVFMGRHEGRGGVYARSWSPDGSKIAISHEGDIWIAKSAGGTPVQITKTPETEGWPRWSHDGKQIYYIIKTGRENTFYSIPAFGGEPRKVLDNFYDAAWHPDGKRFVAATKDGNIRIGTTEDITRVVANFEDAGLGDVHDICLSPDAKHIACIGRQGEKGFAGPVLVIAVDNGTTTRIATDDDGAKYWLSWSPDGKWISYNSDGSVKVRPEGTMWEANFDQILKKVSR